MNDRSWMNRHSLRYSRTHTLRTFPP